MKRRSFIKKAIGGASLPLMLNGIPLNIIANEFTNLLANSSNDHVMVMIQLAGGNDGLNTLVPINQYDTYNSYRSNIAIPNSGNRKYKIVNPNEPVTNQLGLHPDMQDTLTMYDNNLVTIVQNVGYDDMTLSHFRGRDIMFMGGGVNDYYASGWMGRFLNETYVGYPENYPNDEMPDPLGIEFGYAQSLAFQRETGIPAGLAIYDPETFYQLVTGTGVEPPTWLPDTYAGDELKYLMDLELTSNQYANRIKEVYDSGINSSSVIYPEEYPHEVPNAYKNNPLSWQLKNIARLLSGGSKTKLFIVKIDGFDNHANQVIEGNTSMGIHAALLYHLSSSVKAFYDDLKEQNLDTKVLTVTTSEFGRRVNSNDSLGTDHGKAAPVFLFGPMLKEKIIGNVPDLSNLDDGNLIYEYDYRQIYTSIVMDWLQAPIDLVETIYWGNFIDTRLDLFKDINAICENNQQNSISNLNIYPNPAKENTTIKIKLNYNRNISITLLNIKGQKLINIYDGKLSKGEHQFKIDIRHLAPSFYLVRAKSGLLVLNKKLIVT